jgi:hypothetical protein
MLERRTVKVFLLRSSVTGPAGVKRVGIHRGLGPVWLHPLLVEERACFLAHLDRLDVRRAAVADLTGPVVERYLAQRPWRPRWRPWAEQLTLLQTIAGIRARAHDHRRDR